MKRTAKSKSLRRRATAYWRLANRRDFSGYQRDHFTKMAQRLEREAAREESRS